MMKPDGNPDQQRPVFSDFDAAITALQSFKKAWTKQMGAHRSKRG